MVYYTSPKKLDKAWDFSTFAGAPGSPNGGPGSSFRTLT